MNTQETILQLEGLKLKGMAECYKALQSMPASQWPALDTFIARLAEAERQYRNRKRTEMYLKTSKLRYKWLIPYLRVVWGNEHSHRSGGILYFRPIFTLN